MTSKLSDKYIAGFLDADGAIGIAWSRVDRADSNPELKRAYISVRFCQAMKNDEVIYRIKESVGGLITKRERSEPLITLALTGKKAVMLLERIRKHLILKRHYADVCLDMNGKVYNRKEASANLKEQRKVRSLPLPNFPPRKWLAGYFDGDGSIQVRTPKTRTAAQIALQIACSDYDSEGIEVIQKGFGGSINPLTKDRDHLRMWTLTLPPSKAKQTLGYFAKHLVTKKDQAKFILGCAKMGHYRDGKNIKLALKQLKAHPHRLNEPRLSVSDLLLSIGDNKTRRVFYRDLFTSNNGCLNCGSSNYCCDGLCPQCYHQKRIGKVKLQSELQYAI